MMSKRTGPAAAFSGFAIAAAFLAIAVPAYAGIDGVTGTTFDFTAKTDYIYTPDGSAYAIWGYALGDDSDGMAQAQLPGPTLIVDQGATVTINLRNHIFVWIGDAPNVSLVFPGQEGVTATGGSAGLLTQEASPDDLLTVADEAEATMVTYSFVASRPGTFAYHSGTRSDLEVEMGLTGVIVVRPSGYDPGAPTAYGHADTAYDREHLFMLSEIDPRIHDLIDVEGVAALDATDYLSNYFSTYWLINGRMAPDTMAEAGAPWMPAQPYNSLPRMHPGERLLMRVVGVGREMHPFHHHGNHAHVVARDGQMLSSSAISGADLGYEVFTVQSYPGATYDAIFTWTGKGLGWDIYGTGPEYAHTCNNPTGYDTTTQEWCPDHEKPFPVVLPENLELTFGGWYTGSPYLGVMGMLPPGEGGMNPTAGYTYMWHSHTEKELTNNDIFPGGLMTMLTVEAPGVPIP